MTRAEYLGYSGTGNCDTRATKEVVRKIIAARDLIKYHPLTSELATELFSQQRYGSLPLLSGTY